jgi:Holliday junction resolvase RusA-like endonuclease
MSLTWTVRGLPVAQGSLRAFVRGGRPVLTSTARGLRDWRQAIAWEARAAMAPGMEPLRGPLGLEAVFTLPRPRSRPKRETLPDRRPDLDKLARALLDGCSGVVWHDDAQIVDLRVVKTYGAVPGVSVRVWEAA